MSMSYQIFIFTYSITNGILFDNKKGSIQPPKISLKPAPAGTSRILFYCFLFLFLEICNNSALSFLCLDHLLDVIHKGVELCCSQISLVPASHRDGALSGLLLA